MKRPLVLADGIDNNDASILFNQMHLSEDLSKTITRDYWERHLLGTMGIRLDGVWDTQAEMYAAVGNPPPDTAIGNTYAYSLGSNPQIWQLVQVEG